MTKIDELKALAAARPEHPVSLAAFVGLMEMVDQQAVLIDQLTAAVGRLTDIVTKTPPNREVR